MFGFTKNKKIDTKKINNFNKILKVIEGFILLKDFDKAEKAINEIIGKENKSFHSYLETVKESEKKKELDSFKSKIDKVYKLKEKCDNEKQKYQLYIKTQKKKQEKKVILSKIDELLSVGDFQKIIDLLNDFLEKNKNDVSIINFVNVQKPRINRIIEKDKIKKEKLIRQDTLKQAQELVGEIKLNNLSDENSQGGNIFGFIKQKLSFYTNLKKKIKEKKMIDEIDILLQAQNEKNDLIVKSKLAQVHSGVVKEIKNEKIDGYELYGKIMGADKISGDALGFYASDKNYTFFIGDATGHGIRAGFIITQLTKIFQDIVGKSSLEKIVFEINNSLKQDLKSGNFITSIFFQINKKDTSKIDFVGMGHEPMFVYRKETGDVEKVIPGGLATGIRIIKDITQIKPKSIAMQDGDILIAYTDGIVEARDLDGEMYSIERIGKILKRIASRETAISTIYNTIIEDLKNFTGGKSNYNDDVSILLVKKDKNKDIITKDKEIEKLLVKEGLNNSKVKHKIVGKNFEDAKKEILRIQKDNELKNILKSLDTLYRTGELSKLKQDCVRYVKSGYIHKKINFYLKKSLDNENDFKVKQKNKKIQDKYNILNELYKKGDYETVIMECSNIITKDGNI